MAQAKQAKQESDSDSEVEAIVLMTTICNFSNNGDAETWYLDTGCSNHMTCNLNWLVNLGNSRRCTIKFADNSTVKSMGVGNVAFKRSDGSLAIIEKVMYVPDMRYNLMSLGQLLEKGFSAS